MDETDLVLTRIRGQTVLISASPRAQEWVSTYFQPDHPHEGEGYVLVGEHIAEALTAAMEQRLRVFQIARPA